MTDKKVIELTEKEKEEIREGIKKSPFIHKTLVMDLEDYSLQWLLNKMQPNIDQGMKLEDMVFVLDDDDEIRLELHNAKLSDQEFEDEFNQRCKSALFTKKINYNNYLQLKVHFEDEEK